MNLVEICFSCIKVIFQCRLYYDSKHSCGSEVTVYMEKMLDLWYPRNISHSFWPFSYYKIKLLLEIVVHEYVFTTNICILNSVFQIIISLKMTVEKLQWAYHYREQKKYTAWTQTLLWNSSISTTTFLLVWYQNPVYDVCNGIISE